MRLEDHPGYFGITSRGIIAIHADWPMYPSERGWEEALLDSAVCPAQRVSFRSMTSTDASLFLAGPVPVQQDPFDERFSHVAAWHDDMVELIEKSYVD